MKTVILLAIGFIWGVVAVMAWALCAAGDDRDKPDKKDR